MLAASKQAPPPDHPAYRSVWKICSRLGLIFDELIFRPLDGDRGKIISIQAVIPQGWGSPSIHITSWHGYRDVSGKDGGPSGFWIKAVEGSLSHGGIEGDTVPLDPDRPDIGLAHPSELKGKVRKAVMMIYVLLGIAEKLHHGLAAGPERSLNFEQLNDAAYEGLAAGRDDQSDDAPVRQLESLCEESGLEQVEFGSFVTGATPDSFTVKTSIVMNGRARNVMVWAEPSGDGRGDTHWLLVGGWVQRLPREGTDDPAVDWSFEDKQTSRLVKHTADRLTEIHKAAVAIYKDVTTGNPDTAFALLSAVARKATAENPEDRPHEGRAWSALVDDFVRLCRLGAVAGLVVDESPHGNLNIRADTFDPITDKKGPAAGVLGKAR